MKEKYIIIVSDYNPILSKIMSQLESIEGYSNLTVNSISLLNQLLTTVTPELLIFSFKNNFLELSRFCRMKAHSIPPILCLINRYEKLNLSSFTTPIIVQSVETCLENNHLLTNIKSLFLLKKAKETKYELVKNAIQKQASFITENKNLARYVLELDQKKELLRNMTEKMKELCISADQVTKKRIYSIINNIKLDASTNHWDDFKVYFENINPGFISQLSKKYPCLTPKDIKYCCYLKMNMSNEDIRYILGINKESVRTHKYRLKKKMTLEKEQNLKNYINSF